jgi:multidrug efflux pump subunit AcrA (membrane-fusion protein)
VTAAVEGASPANKFEGKIVFIAPQIDPQTRTATVRMALPNMQLVAEAGHVSRLRTSARSSPSRRAARPARGGA